MTAVADPVRLIEPGATVFSAAEIRVVRSHTHLLCAASHSLLRMKVLEAVDADKHMRHVSSDTTGHERS